MIFSFVAEGPILLFILISIVFHSLQYVRMSDNTKNVHYFYFKYFIVSFDIEIQFASLVLLSLSPFH